MSDRAGRTFQATRRSWSAWMSAASGSLDERGLRQLSAKPIALEFVTADVFADFIVYSPSGEPRLAVEVKGAAPEGRAAKHGPIA